MSIIFEQGKLDGFRHQLAEGAYTSVGCYPKYFVTADGGVLSVKAALENKRLVERAMRLPGTDKQWQVVGCDINWESTDLYCDDSGERIESAYAEDSVAE
jgi:hypothetical protein